MANNVSSYDWCKFSKNSTNKAVETKPSKISIVKEDKPKKTVLKAKTPIKKKGNKARTKAVDISPKVKKIVLERDNGLCVICGKIGIPNMHYKRRSQGGLGIEQNVVCGCLQCHTDYDNGLKLEEYKKIIKKHLKGIYGASWNEKNLIYKKE